MRRNLNLPANEEENRKSFTIIVGLDHFIRNLNLPANEEENKDSFTVKVGLDHFIKNNPSDDSGKTQHFQNIF